MCITVLIKKWLFLEWNKIKNKTVLLKTIGDNLCNLSESKYFGIITKLYVSFTFCRKFYYLGTIDDWIQFMSIIKCGRKKPWKKSKEARNCLNFLQYPKINDLLKADGNHKQSTAGTNESHSFKYRHICCWANRMNPQHLNYSHNQVSAFHQEKQ